MKTLHRRGLATLAVSALLAFCASGCTSNPPLTKEHLQECMCGTEEADLLGCTAACCAGDVACDNPLCTCEGNTLKTSKSSGGR